MDAKHSRLVTRALGDTAPVQGRAFHDMQPVFTPEVMFSYSVSSPAEELTRNCMAAKPTMCMFPLSALEKA